ncbi:MAG: hypothetical protein IPI88_10810 [Chitinophagaceae bacterium]|nr:hypothetical protein [Chitinophagaceae bacterium]
MPSVFHFSSEIGIETRFEKLDEPWLLPGPSIRNGIIMIRKRSTVGDILHEAGHIAVVPAAERNTLSAAK